MAGHGRVCRSLARLSVTLFYYLNVESILDGMQLYFNASGKAFDSNAVRGQVVKRRFYELMYQEYSRVTV